MEEEQGAAYCGRFAPFMRGTESTPLAAVFIHADV